MPRPIGRYDDGHWIAVAMEEIDGRCPPVPWSDEHVDAAMDTLEALAADLTPSPISGLSPVPEGLASIFFGWQRLRDQPHPALDPWISDRLDELIELSAGALHRLDGDTVVHCDLRADNLLVRPDGSMVVVDWPWALTGPDSLDRLLLLINIDLYGGQDAEQLVALLAAGGPVVDHRLSRRDVCVLHRCRSAARRAGSADLAGLPAGAGRLDHGLAAAAPRGARVTPSVGVRLVSVDDVAELTALVVRNLDFLAPWDPLREEDTRPSPSNAG